MVTSGLLASCSSHRKAADPPPTTATTSSTTPAPTTTTVYSGPRCPLTNLVPPPGGIPARPALAVKVDNSPPARPQYGLGSADVVYEEPVEGGITRLIAIYQCRDSTRVQPVRSGRIVDPQIIDQYGARPLLAYSGGIPPAVSAIRSSAVIDVGIDRVQDAYWRDSSRPSPHNLATSTSGLYGSAVARRAPSQAPAAAWSFGALPQTAAATPASAVNIPYMYSNVTWRWDPAAHAWSRSYADSGTAGMGEGGQITAANVVVMKVVLYQSAYVEDETGAHENLLVLTGSGSVQIFRDGSVITGHWSRSSLGHPTEYLDPAGNPIPFSDGTTWIELVPTSLPANVTP